MRSDPVLSAQKSQAKHNLLHRFEEGTGILVALPVSSRGGEHVPINLEIPLIGFKQPRFPTTGGPHLDNGQVAAFSVELQGPSATRPEVSAEAAAPATAPALRLRKSLLDVI